MFKPNPVNSISSKQNWFEKYPSASLLHSSPREMLVNTKPFEEEKKKSLRFAGILMVILDFAVVINIIDWIINGIPPFSLNLFSQVMYLAGAVFTSISYYDNRKSLSQAFDRVELYKIPTGLALVWYEFTFSTARAVEFAADEVRITSRNIFGKEYPTLSYIENFADDFSDTQRNILVVKLEYTDELDRIFDIIQSKFI